MSHFPPSLKAGKRQVEHATKPWLERLARWGLGAKGSVYLIVGLLAARMVLGRGGATTDTRGALHAIAGRSYGVVLLLLVAVGLVGYALWRFVFAWADPNGDGMSFTGLAKRAGSGVSGVSSSALALAAVRIVQGRHAAGSSSETAQSWTARLLHAPLGRWLVGLVGVGILLFYLYQVYRASQGELPEHLAVGSVGGVDGQWVRRLGGFGLAAQGVVFGLTGVLLIQAALHADAQQAGGLDRALQTLAQQRGGQALLGVMAVGLMAYGSYVLLLAWSQRHLIP